MLAWPRKVSSDAAALGGIILSAVIAILTGFIWLVTQINAVRKEIADSFDKQNVYRHDNTNRIAAVIGEVEDRLTRRIERVENGREHGSRRWSEDK